MNYDKVYDAVLARNQLFAGPHTATIALIDAGLKALFDQMGTQFTSETGAMNRRLDEMVDRANERYGKTAAAADRANGSAVDAADSASRADDSAEIAKDFSEVAEEGANAAEAVEERTDGEMELRNMISTQAETIGELQEELETADLVSANRIAANKNLQKELDAAKANVRDTLVTQDHIWKRAYASAERVNELTKIILDRDVRIAELSDTTLNHRVETQAETIARQSAKLQELHAALTVGCVDSVVRIEDARHILYG